MSIWNLYKHHYRHRLYHRNYWIISSNLKKSSTLVQANCSRAWLHKKWVIMKGGRGYYFAFELISSGVILFCDIEGTIKLPYHSIPSVLPNILTLHKPKRLPALLTQKYPTNTIFFRGMVPIEKCQICQLTVIILTNEMLHDCIGRCT